MDKTFKELSKALGGNPPREVALAMADHEYMIQKVQTNHNEEIQRLKKNAAEFEAIKEELAAVKLRYDNLEEQWTIALDDVGELRMEKAKADLHATEITKTLEKQETKIRTMRDEIVRLEWRAGVEAASKKIRHNEKFNTDS